MGEPALLRAWLSHPAAQGLGLGTRAQPRPERLLTAMHLSSEKLRELTSRFFFVWRKDTGGFGQGQGLAASTGPLGADAVAGGFSRPGVMASYRSLSSGWGGGGTAGVWSRTPGRPPASCRRLPCAHQAPDLRWDAASVSPFQIGTPSRHRVPLDGSEWGRRVQSCAPAVDTPGLGALPHRPHSGGEECVPGGRQQTGSPQKAQTGPPGNGAQARPACRGCTCPPRRGSAGRGAG